MLGIDAYPLRVLIFRRRQNGFVPVNDRGRLQEVKAKKNKKIILGKYLRLKKLKTTIPLPETNFYQEIEGFQYLYLVQLDRYTFYPVEITTEDINVKRPIYEYDEEKPIYQMKDNKIVTDPETGEKIVIGFETKKNDQGDPIVKKYENVQISGLDWMLDNGKIVKVPKMHIVKTYDPKEFMATEQERDASLYGKKGFLEQWGAIISFTLLGVLVITLLYIAFKNLTPIFQQVIAAGQAVANSNAQVADALRIISENFGTDGVKAASQSAPPF